MPIFFSEAIGALATGLRLRADRDIRYRSWSAMGPNMPNQMAILYAGADSDAAQQQLTRAQTVADAVCLARALVNAPPNHMLPRALITAAEDLRSLGVEVDSFIGDVQLGAIFPGVVAVGAGSAEDSGVAIMSWMGGGDAPLIALSAKGVTFDSGGLTLKPESGQRLMKVDMCGAACAIAAMQAVARMRLPINLVCAIGAVENLPGNHAFRSGDVITMSNGTTVEISFPDAEGRIVMADLNHYLATRFNPEIIINVAGLTYSAVAALGDGCMALFANDDGLASSLLTASDSAGELFWRLPLGARYRQLLRSDIADFKNMIAPGQWGLAGSASAAAEFLRHFAGERKWAHLDILAAVWSSADHDLGPVGATGEPTRTLIQWLETQAA